MLAGSFVLPSGSDLQREDTSWSVILVEREAETEMMITHQTATVRVLSSANRSSGMVQ